jgi:ribonuclease P/MRP protein subunit RPP40
MPHQPTGNARELDESTGWRIWTGYSVFRIDYRKAFDSVPHQRLLEKLKTFGINGKLLQWLENFLVSRTMRVGVRGMFSQMQAVLSGVPQGSVLGPLLFLLFVNELPSWIKNDMRMFADDTKVWCRIRTATDSITLQEDLDRLSLWSSTWQLKFNAEKCMVMHIGQPRGTKYYMTEGSAKKELESVQEERDLGVIITSDLKSSRQCIKAAATARRIIGMVRRNFRHLDIEDFILIYKTYIRSHLEYCIQAWSPHLVKDIKILERVQKAATNLVSKLRKYSYPIRLQKLGITSLKDRRERGDMIEVYKILTGKEKIDSKQFFRFAGNPHGLRGHEMKIVKERSRLDTRKFFFSQRAVNGWNSLPARVVNAESVNAFKNAYDRNQHKDMDVRS